MDAILAACLSNLSYALADNADGFVTKKNHPLKLAFWICLSSIIIFFIPAILFFSNEFSHLTFSNLTTMLLINVIVNIGYLCFVTSMNRGSVTLTGVIGGAFPAVTTLIALLVFKEQVTAYQLWFILLIFAGIILSSMSGPAKKLFYNTKASGILFAFGAFFFWGLYFALIRIPVDQIGWFLPQYSLNFVGLLMFYLIARITKNKDITSRPNLLSIIILVSSLQTFGTILFNYAISKDQTSVVAPIAGSSPAVFVIFAYFLFKEKLNKKQWFGIISALVGIIGLSLVS